MNKPVPVGRCLFMNKVKEKLFFNVVVASGNQLTTNPLLSDHIVLRLVAN